MGSLGCGIGIIVLSYTEYDQSDWKYGFWLIIAVSMILSAVPLIKIVYEEIIEIKNIINNRKL